MTFGELLEFVQDAMRCDVERDEIVFINATWRSSIKAMKVKGSIPKELNESTDG